MNYSEFLDGLIVFGLYPPTGGGGGGTVTNVGTGTGLTGGPITGSGVISLATISTLTVLANITGGTAAPTPHTVSALFDAVFDNTQGDILYRNGTVWTYLGPGTAGQVLTTGGAGANPSWAGGAGGTVTSVATGTGLTGGTITTTGTVALASITALTVLANITGGSAAPTPHTVSALLDATIDNTQGDVLYRNGTVWTYLAPGTAGYVLTTGGPAANPSWTAPGTGTVTSVATGTGLTGGTITTTGTVALASISTLTVLANITGGSAAPTPHTVSALLDATLGSTQGDILYRNSTVWTVLAPGTAGHLLATGGPAANPSWVASPAGTVSSVATGAGLTGGTITTTGTVSFATVVTGSILANISGITAVPSPHALTAIFANAFGSTQGDILYCSATGWTTLAPGTAGEVLITGGASANPSWGATPGTPWDILVIGAETFTPFTSYVANAAITPLVFSLPLTANLGDFYVVAGMSSVGFQIAQNAGQNVLINGGSTTVGTGGSISTVDPTAGFTLICVVANTTWLAAQISGSFTVV